MLSFNQFCTDKRFTSGTVGNFEYWLGKRATVNRNAKQWEQLLKQYQTWLVQPTEE